jgi:hypothetical protein
MLLLLAVVVLLTGSLVVSSAIQGGTKLSSVQGSQGPRSQIQKGKGPECEESEEREECPTPTVPPTFTPIPTVPPTVMPIPPRQTQTETFLVSVYAPAGVEGLPFNPHRICKLIQDDPAAHFTVSPPWKIDKTQGDLPDHPGLHDVANDNANNWMHAYNYVAPDDHTVQISGEVCGSPNPLGPGATFKHTYTVYETQ